MNPVQMSLLKKSGVWMFKTLSMMVAVIPPRLDVSSEHRDESRVITNIETGQNSRKVIRNIDRDGSKSRKNVVFDIATKQNVNQEHRRRFRTCCIPSENTGEG